MPCLACLLSVLWCSCGEPNNRPELPPRALARAVRLRENKEQKTWRRTPWVDVALPSGDVFVPAALRAEGEPHPECHTAARGAHCMPPLRTYISRNAVLELDEVLSRPASRPMMLAASAPAMRLPRTCGQPPEPCPMLLVPMKSLSSITHPQVPAGLPAALPQK